MSVQLTAVSFTLSGEEFDSMYEVTQVVSKSEFIKFY